jgi:hypothetical protein
MAITVVCPACAARLSAPDRAAGRRAKCTSCQGIIVVPSPSAVPPPPPPAASPFTDIDAPAPVQHDAYPRAPTPPRRNDRMKYVVGIVLAAIGTIAAVALYFILSSRPPADQAVKVGLRQLYDDYNKGDAPAADLKYRDRIVEVSGFLNSGPTPRGDGGYGLGLSDAPDGHYLACAIFRASQRERLVGLKKGDRLTVRGTCKGGGIVELENCARVD